MNHFFLFISSLLIINLFFIGKALAMCPICSIAAAGGIGLSRYLGIDDSITGLWIGGLIVSTSMWTDNLLKAKKINFKFQSIIVAVIYYSLTIVPLYTYDLIGHPINSLIWGLDKLIFGVIAGSVAFWYGSNFHYILKAKNNNKSYFPFQKVVLPVLPLIILSIIFYLLAK